MSEPPPNLLIFGASARAAAFSALRAGLSPWCADLFADADLRRRCPAVRLSGPYPAGFLDLIGADRPGPWMYTGGLENHPLLVGQMQAHRPLWGNGPSSLLRVRAPETLTAAAAAAGLPPPDQALDGPVPATRAWLLKPRGGAAGAGIRVARPGETIRTGWYAQEFIAGTPASALFVAVAGRCVTLGLTRQLVGEPWLHAPAFRYCGSVGPLTAGAALAEKLGRLGAVLTRRADLAGVFGIDGVLAADTFRPVEVNPRYTASVEVLELATGLRALDLHRRAFEGVPGPPAGKAPTRPGVVGKAVVYAPADGLFPDSGPWLEGLRLPLDVTPAFADLPHAGDVIRRGQPILTVFARGQDPAACERQLRQRAAEVVRLLYPGGLPPVGVRS